MNKTKSIDVLITLGNRANQVHDHSEKGFSVKEGPFVKELGSASTLPG